MVREETYTVTAKPDQWAFVNAYEGFIQGDRERFGVVLTDASLLPEDVAHEVKPTKRGHVYLMSFVRPAIEWEGGRWKFLETALQRMAVTNRRPDALFEGRTLEITFSVLRLPPRANSEFTTPLMILPVHQIKIVGKPTAIDRYPNAD